MSKVLGRKPYSHFSDEQVEEILQAARLLRKENWEWPKIAQHLRMGTDWVRRRLDPDYRKAKNDSVALGRASREATRSFRQVHRPMPEYELKRLRQAERGRPDTRDLTGILLGDPPYHRSALAKKQSQQ